MDVFIDILKIAVYCIVLGGASIPLSFHVNSSPAVVWSGNALGSLISAVFVIFVMRRIVSDAFRSKVSRVRIGKKIVTIYDAGSDSKNVKKAQVIINKHGLRLFSLVCPVFPGVLVSTIAVYLLELDTKIYKRWMFAGVVLVSGGYVYGYWWLFVR